MEERYNVIYYEGVGVNIYSDSELELMDTSDEFAIIYYKGSYQECIDYLDNI